MGSCSPADSVRPSFSHRRATILPPGFRMVLPPLYAECALFQGDFPPLPAQNFPTAPNQHHAFETCLGKPGNTGLSLPPGALSTRFRLFRAESGAFFSFSLFCGRKIFGFVFMQVAICWLQIEVIGDSIQPGRVLLDIVQLRYLRGAMAQQICYLSGGQGFYCAVLLLNPVHQARCEGVSE